MNGAKNARLVTNRKGESVWRCGWGTRDGRGCQETFGVIEIYRTQDGEITFPRIRLADGYEERPEGHADAGTYFYTNRPGNRTYRSQGIKERSQAYRAETQQEYDEMIGICKRQLEEEGLSANQRQEIESRLHAFERACSRDIPSSLALSTQEKERRERREHFLINNPSPWGNGFPGIDEETLPKNIRCKACKRLSRITTTGTIPA